MSFERLCKTVIVKGGRNTFHNKANKRNFDHHDHPKDNTGRNYFGLKKNTVNF